MQLNEIDDCEALFQHYFYGGDSVMTEDQALDREVQAYLSAFKVAESFGVAFWDNCTDEDDAIEVSLFDDVVEAEKYFDNSVQIEAEKNGYSVIVQDEHEKRAYLEYVVEKDLFEELGAYFPVIAKQAQNDEYEYQVYTEDREILLIDKFEGDSNEVKKALELVDELNITSLQKSKESFGFNRYLEIENEDGDKICITLSPYIQLYVNRNYLAILKNQIVKEFAELKDE